MTLGSTLKKERQAQKRTQKEVAQGICAQSMLSAIENDRYVPNAVLLIELCERLKISVDGLSLATDFAVSPIQQFNQTVSDLCNQHEYEALRAFLLEPEVADQVAESEQLQAYYYYLGVAEFQTQTTVNEALKTLQLSVADADTQKASILTRLGWITMAVLRAYLNQTSGVQELIQQATVDLESLPYESNANIIYFLAGLANYELRDYSHAIGWLE